jgi:hypothetical protein
MAKVVVVEVVGVTGAGVSTKACIKCEGLFVGLWLGLIDGLVEGIVDCVTLGLSEGDTEGVDDGWKLGAPVGVAVGYFVTGDKDGVSVLGAADGISLAVIEGVDDGITVGGTGLSVNKFSSTKPTPPKQSLRTT